MQIEKMIIDLMKPETMFHWGRTIVSTEPTTGIGNEAEVGYLSDDVWNNGIDPDLIEYEKEHPEEEVENWDVGKMYLGLIQAEDGKYDIDPTAPFAVVWSDWAGGTYSILKSPYVQFCTPCSPCCPGQVSLGQPGDYLGFSPSIEGFNEDDTDIPEVWVWDLEYEHTHVIETMTSVRKYIEQRQNGKYPMSCEEVMEAERKLMNMSGYLGALSSALAENQKNTKQRILVKQQRIE